MSVPVPLRGLGRPDGYGTVMGWVWDRYGTGMGQLWDGYGTVKGRDGELDKIIFERIFFYLLLSVK